MFKEYTKKKREFREISRLIGFVNLAKSQCVPQNQINMNEIPSKNFCIYPWVHTQIDSDGSFVTCCEVTLEDRLTKVSESEIKKAWNSDAYKSLRKMFLEGEAPRQCQGCFEKESHGHESDRLKANEWYKDSFENVKLTNQDGELPFESLKSLDLRVSNTCNFKCRTCTPAASSALAREWPFVSPKNVPPVNRKAFESDQACVQYLKPALEQIERLYFAGGEPFLQTEHFAVLEYLIKTKRSRDVELFYNTNLSTEKFAGKEIVKLLCEFKKISINMSLDDCYERGEYLRDGLKWEDFKETYFYMKDSLENAEFYLNITVSNMNSYYLPEFLDVCLDELKMEKERIIINPVTVPEYYHLANLPLETKSKVLNKLKIYYEKNSGDVLAEKIKVLANMIQEEHDEKFLKAFKQVTRRIDQVRGQSFSKLFPELKELVAVKE